MRQAIRLVIFDCDGVLVDSEPIMNRALAEQLRGIGLSLPLDDVMRRFLGKTRDQCLALAAEIAGHPLPERFGADWGAAVFEALRREARPVAGVPEVLRTLAIPYCAASNGMPDRVRLALESAGLLPWFEERIFTSADVRNPKPAPDLFLHAAQAMKVPPAASAVVEDTPIGVRAARAAGMRAFGFTGCSHADAASLEREGAVAVFNDIRLLPEMLLAEDAHNR